MHFCQALTMLKNALLKRSTGLNDNVEFVAMENQYKSLLIYLYLAFLKFALELFSHLPLFSIICMNNYGCIN